MGYGYALLPTADAPTSTLSFRLTPSEKRERDEWIHGAHAHGLTVAAIAYEVGLSIPRVKQILFPPRRKTKLTPSSRPFRGTTPRDREVHDFWTNHAHPSCRQAWSNPIEHGLPCSSCYGNFSLIESCYDSAGQPHSWARHNNLFI